MLRRLLLIRRRGKIKPLHLLLRTFPCRRFVLVGDSGERDPEIYGALARKFRHQIKAIYIREIPQKPMDPERLRKVFHGIPRDRWLVFRTPAELPTRLDELSAPIEQPLAGLEIQSSPTP